MFENKITEPIKVAVNQHKKKCATKPTKMISSIMSFTCTKYTIQINYTFLYHSILLTNVFVARSLDRSESKPKTFNQNTIE